MDLGRSFAPNAAGVDTCSLAAISAKWRNGQMYFPFPSKSCFGLKRAHISCCQRWHSSHCTHYKHTTVNRIQYQIYTMELTAKGTKKTKHTDSSTSSSFLSLCSFVLEKIIPLNEILPQRDPLKHNRQKQYLAPLSSSVQ